MSSRSKRNNADGKSELAWMLSERIVGQAEPIEAIVPYIHMYQAGLSPEGRPAGVFLLLGPTGTGKTRTVESLAEVLHGSERNLLKIDCGEFQMEHEVAKLIGAPPGYLGHRETQPALTQAKLNAVSSEHCSLSIVLFDEIEKAAPSLTRLLLGVLDRGQLRLGDNSFVNFERTLVFLTSNLGAAGMAKQLKPEFGFETFTGSSDNPSRKKLDSIAITAVQRHFSPEFINRIDSVLTYRPLTKASLELILDQQIRNFQHHVRNRLGARAFHIEVTPSARRFLLQRGTSMQFGARELKRTLQRHLLHPVAELVAAGQVYAGSRITADLGHDKQLEMRVA